MVKGLNKYGNEMQTRILELYEMQMRAFGGKTPERELIEVFRFDEMICVRFKNGEWYHYDIESSAWF